MMAVLRRLFCRRPKPVRHVMEMNDILRGFGADL
jgi:hypothetical protein